MATYYLDVEPEGTIFPVEVESRTVTVGMVLHAWLSKRSEEYRAKPWKLQNSSGRPITEFVMARPGDTIRACL